MNKLFLSLVLALAVPAAAAAERYISDDLGLPLRSGKGLQHKILKLVPSGTRVEVLEESPEEGYSLIRTPEGAEGWVVSRYLVQSPGARERLAGAERRLERLQAQSVRQRETIAALQTELGERRERIAALERRGAEMEAELVRLRELAAEPARIAAERDRMAQALAEAGRRVEALGAENAALRDASLKQWFALGAGVSIGSLILGLIITRIPWRRDRWSFH